MALGSTIGIAQALSEYRAMAGGKLIGEAWSNLLEVIKGNSNVLSVLVGPPGSKKPLTTRDELSAGRRDRVNMNVAASLGMHPRMGSEQLVGYNETPQHGNWTIRVDQKRIAVGWSEFVRSMANTGKSFKETYAELLGERFGQIEQEDALMRFRKDATAGITLYPGGATSVATLRAAHTLDVDTIKRGSAKLSTLGCTPAMIGKTRVTNRPINKFVFFGADGAVRGIKDEIGYNANVVATLSADGVDSPLLDGDFIPIDGQMIMPWYVVDHDNPGPIGSSILPKALLGDASPTHGADPAGTIAAGTTTFDVYGGGVTQADLGDQSDLYKPFVFFDGYPFKHFQEESIGADSAIYGFVVYDPDDGKWCYYDYTGSDNNGKSIAVRRRLGSTTSGVRYTTIKADGLGGSGATIWTYDTAYNKEDFGPGCLIIPVNNYLVPLGDVFGWGADAGGYAYGEFKNQRIIDGGDFGDRTAFGIKSIYGCGVRLDTRNKPRGFVRIRCAVQHEGVNLPVLA